MPPEGYCPANRITPKPIIRCPTVVPMVANNTKVDAAKTAKVGIGRLSKKPALTPRDKPQSIASATTLLPVLAKEPFPVGGNPKDVPSAVGELGPPPSHDATSSRETMPPA